MIDMTTTQTPLETEATEKVAELRAALAAAKHGSKAWRDIEEDLDWWIGRKAFVTAMPSVTR